MLLTMIAVTIVIIVFSNFYLKCEMMCLRKLWVDLKTIRYCIIQYLSVLYILCFCIPSALSQLLWCAGGPSGTLFHVQSHQCCPEAVEHWRLCRHRLRRLTGERINKQFSSKKKVMFTFCVLHPNALCHWSLRTVLNVYASGPAKGNHLQREHS